MSTETFRAFHEAPREGNNERPPETIALQQLSAIFRAKSMRIDLDTLEKKSATPVVLDDSEQGYHEVAEGQPHDGRLYVWSAEGRPVLDDSALTPIAHIESRTDDSVTALTPETAMIFGGSVRVLHGLGTEDVEVMTLTSEGEKIGHLFWLGVNENEVQVEVSENTSRITVQKTTEEPTP